VFNEQDTVDLWVVYDDELKSVRQLVHLIESRLHGDMPAGLSEPELEQQLNHVKVTQYSDAILRITIIEHSVFFDLFFKAGKSGGKFARVSLELKLM
jgi:hypothetical protein